MDWVRSYSRGPRSGGPIHTMGWGARFGGGCRHAMALAVSILVVRGSLLRDASQATTVSASPPDTRGVVESLEHPLATW